MGYVLKGIRYLSLACTQIWPFPFVYLILPFLVIVLSVLLFNALKKRTFRSLKYLLAYIISIFCLFYLSWGFIYLDSTVSQKFKLRPPNYDTEVLIQNFRGATDSLNYLFNTLPESVDIENRKLEDWVRQDLNAFMEAVNLPIYPDVRIRETFDGSLLRMETAGIYFPYALEGHYDGALHPLQKPFTLSHEMLHGYGFGQESDCNFLAFLSCVNSEHAIVKYSAFLAYWRYLASNVRRVDKEQFKDIYSCLSPENQKVLEEMRGIRAKYPALFSKVREKFYDWYLRSNGVKEGLDSYNIFVYMLESWKEQYPIYF